MMKRKLTFKGIVFLLSLFSAAFASGAEPPGGDAAEEARLIIRTGERLDLKRCVEIALMRQPGITSALNGVYAAESRVFQAQSNYYPQVEASAGYSRTASTPSVNRPTISSSRPFDLYTSSIALKQNIYDFGKTSEQVKVQRYNLGSSRHDLENARNQTAFNVKQAYFSVLQAEKNRTVAEEAVKQFERHLDQARGFFEVGAKPRIDVTRAEVDLSNARVNLIKAENSLRLARVTLKNSMGVSGGPDFELEEALTFQKYDITLDDAVSRAFGSRPDLKSIVEKKRSAAENVELSRKGYYPVLSGNAGYNWSGESLPLERGWNLGAAITIPIFSGFLTKYQVEESKANLGVANANEELLRQTVILEVQQAFLSLREAEERIPAAETAVRQAEENLELANGRYSTGVGNPIEAADASVAYNNARLAYFQAVTDYKIAEAALEKAMGGR